MVAFSSVARTFCRLLLLPLPVFSVTHLVSDKRVHDKNAGGGGGGGLHVHVVGS